LPKIKIEFRGPGTELEGTIFDKGLGLAELELLALEFMGLQRPEKLDVSIDAGEVPPVAKGQLDVMARAGVQVIGIGDATTAREVLEPQDLPARLGLALPESLAAPLTAKGQVDMWAPEPAPALKRSEGDKRRDHIMTAVQQLEKAQEPGSQDSRLVGLLARTKGAIDPEASFLGRFSFNTLGGYELVVHVGVDETSTDAKDLRKLVEEKVKNFNPPLTVKLRAWEHMKALAASKHEEIAAKLLKEGFTLERPITHFTGSEDKYAQGTSPKWMIYTDRPVSAALLRELSSILRDDPRRSPRPIQNFYANLTQGGYSSGDVIV
jgi:hypothetical protein